MNLGPRISIGEGSEGSERGRGEWRVYMCTVPGVSVFALHSTLSIHESGYVSPHA